MDSFTRLPLRCWAEIDLAALERNLRLIRGSLPEEIRYVAVVKADAYGHGLPQTAARLMHAGADLFAVANVSEAAAIRELGPGWPILLLSPLLPEEDKFVAEYDLTATVSSLEEVQRMNSVGQAAGRPIEVHLKIDTGMGRLGVWYEDAVSVYEAIQLEKFVKLAGIFTHFASAEDDVAFTEEQRKRFLNTLEKFVGLKTETLFIHADNSAGLETTGGDTVFNAVRIGLLQFGVLPHPQSLLARVKTEPVFSFRTRVALIKRLPAGTTISYGRTFTLKRPTKIAVLAAGYGDGIPRAASNRAFVLVRGFRCPVLGRVTMDQTVIDVSDLAEAAVGDEAVIVGKQGLSEIPLDEFSVWSDSIPYEVLCSITKRVPRVYRTSLGL